MNNVQMVTMTAGLAWLAIIIVLWSILFELKQIRAALEADK